MSQITTGIRSILSIPIVYTFIQNLMGAKSGRRRFAENYIKPFSGMNVLDIGCGPADIFECIPDVNYWGFDIHESYIESAKKKYGSEGHFSTKILNEKNLTGLPKFDVVIAMGVLHHLDESEAIKLVSTAYKSLKNNGRLITVDPCYIGGQNKLAKYLISKDRGQNVTNQYGYESIIKTSFNNYSSEIHHQKWMPYTNCYITATK